MANIKFGTDGFRGIIADTFTFENVELIVKSIIKYVYKTKDTKKILIGYDPRFMADKFANFAANIFAKYGLEPIISDKILPTPVLAFNAKHLNANAVMFTASHNPYEYLGLKFIPSYAGPATNAITDALMKNIADIEKKPQILDKFLVNSPKKILKKDFSLDYFEHLSQIIDIKKIKDAKINIVYDSHYSAGLNHFDKFLNMNKIKFTNLCEEFDPTFANSLPEPKLPYINDLADYVEIHPKSVGFSNDGDADRFGVINENGEQVSANEIICILSRHLAKNKKLKGDIAVTVGASSCHEIMAKKLGKKLKITPVGFKYLGDAMRNYEIMIAGEESGGLSILGHIPEKDGILANLLILEAMAYENKSLVELQQALHKDLGCSFFNTRIDKKLSTQKQLKNALEKFQNLKNVLNLKIKKSLKIDGIKLFLEDNSWILVRASGTEPLLRIYIESQNEEKLEQIKVFLQELI